MMIKMTKLKFFTLILTFILTVSLKASAKSMEALSEVAAQTERSLTPEGNANMLDNIEDTENIQFITVTARDGSVFYIIIDKMSRENNVYFLNQVDESDLKAFTEEDDTSEIEKLLVKTKSTDTEENRELQPSLREEAKPEKKSKKSSAVPVMLILAAVGFGVFYYYKKILLPKKKQNEDEYSDEFEYEEENNMD